MCNWVCLGYHNKGPQWPPHIKYELWLQVSKACKWMWLLLPWGGPSWVLQIWHKGKQSTNPAINWQKVKWTVCCIERQITHLSFEPATGEQVTPGNQANLLSLSVYLYVYISTMWIWAASFDDKWITRQPDEKGLLSFLLLCVWPSGHWMQLQLAQLFSSSPMRGEEKDKPLWLWSLEKSCVITLV